MGTPFRVDPNDYDRFVLRQRFRPVVNEYEFSLPEGNGDKPGRPFCFVRQRRFTLKEDIRFYADDSRSVELMRIKARQRFDPRARYDVTTADGSKIGEIQRSSGRACCAPRTVFTTPRGRRWRPLQSRVSRWHCSAGLWGSCPTSRAFRTGFPSLITSRSNGTESCWGPIAVTSVKLLDVYTIDMSGDPERSVDRRLSLAIAVGMDALQAR